MQNLLATLTGCVLLAGAAAAQGSFELPTSSFQQQSSSTPIGSQVIRYQQWYSPFEVLAFQQKPIRITGFEFKAAANAGSQPQRTIELQVTMSNGPTSPPTGRFDSNLRSGTVVVLPRSFVNIAPATPGSYPVSINFQSEFIWDGSSGLILDLRIFDNGNSNQSYQYDLEFHPRTLGKMYRLFTVGDPNASGAQFQPQDAGITTRFLFNEALDLPYGQGCRAEGGTIPLATTAGGFPTPGNFGYEFQLRNAPSQRTAVWWFGLSDQTWVGNPLPLDLGFINAPGCSILAEVIDTIATQTVGGGPGSGLARVPLPWPNTTDYLGTPIYSQWVVIDPNAPNGLLAVSNGVWTLPALQ